MLAFGLPKAFDLLIKPISYRSQTYYSDLNHQFYSHQKTDSGTFHTDQDNNIISRQEYESALPLMYYQKLLLKGELPDSLAGYALTPELIGTTNKFFKIQPRHINQPQILVFPNCHTNPKKDRIENIFFAFNEQIKIITPATNSVDKYQTDTFSKILSDKHFSFPVKKVFGRLNRKDAINEGIFVVDANNHFFNLYFDQQAEPAVNIIPLPNNTQVETMINTSFKDRSVYGIIIDQNNNLYILESETYNLIKLPVEKYNSLKDEIIWAGNILTTTINVSTPDSVFTYAFESDNGSLIGKFTTALSRGNRDIITQWRNAFLPFTLTTKVPYSRIAHLTIENAPLNWWLINCGLTLLLYCVLLLRNKRKDWIGLGLIALTGIYGLLTCLLIKPHNKA